MPPESVSRSPKSYLVWSEHRDRSAVLAADLACALDREFHWIDIHDSVSPRTTTETELLEKIGPERVHAVTPSQMAPDESGGNVALWMAFRGHSDNNDIDHTTRFARLPEPVRRISAGADPDGPPRGMVVAHADRAAYQFPDAPGTLRPYLEVLKRSNIVPVFSYGTVPRRNVTDFDVVLRVAPQSDGGQVTVEQGAVLLEEVLEGRRTLTLEEFLTAWRRSS